MRITKVILPIFGSMGSGKSTLADMLNQTDYSVRVINFADPLKQAAELMLGIPMSISTGTQDDKANFRVYGKSAREWLQWLGTDIGKDMVDQCIWVNSFVNSAIGSSHEIIVAADGRFPDDEITGLKERVVGVAKVMPIRIHRDTGHSPVHRSEMSLESTPDSEFSFVVDNNNSLSSLEKRAGEIYTVARDYLNNQRKKSSL